MTVLDSSATETARYARGGRGNYDLVVAAFCGLLLISNVGATKAIAFGLPVTLPVLVAGREREQQSKPEKGDTPVQRPWNRLRAGKVLPPRFGEQRPVGERLCGDRQRECEAHSLPP